MRDDIRFDRYFSVRAGGIELPPPSIALVMDRAARRHRHRRAAVSACTAVVVLTAALSVSNLGDTPATEEVFARPAGPVLIESSLVWNAVTPKVALSWANSTVVGPGNAIYSLSTAPGPVATGDGPSPATLYRSTDGIEWAPAVLPDNLNASSLATSDRFLYAIGTAPAGGSLRAVQLASTSADGAPWAQATLPIDVDELEARYGLQLGLSRLTVASDGTRVVAAVRVQVNDDIQGLLPAGVDVSQGGFGVSETGIVVYAKPTEFDKEPQARRPIAPAITATYTWEQLGIESSLRSLILGETRVFVSDDGVTFTETSLPDPVRLLGSLLATADGFTLIGSAAASDAAIESWSSADGRSWLSDGGSATSGYVLASGTRRDRAAVIVGGQDQTGEQTATIKVQQGGGRWSEISVTDLLRQAGIDGQFYPSSAAVGPLGAALVVTQHSADERQHSFLVTTTDGIEASVTDLAPLVGDGAAGDVRVSADSITVTVISPGAADGTPVQLLVGTPKR